ANIAPQRDEVGVGTRRKDTDWLKAASFFPVLRRQHLHRRFVLGRDHDNRTIELLAGPWPTGLNRGAIPLELQGDILRALLTAIGHHGEMWRGHLHPAVLSSCGGHSKQQ